MPAVQAMAAQQQADALLGYGAGEPDLFIKAAPMEAPADSTAADAAWGAGQWCLSDRGAMNLLGLLLTLPPRELERQCRRHHHCMGARAALAPGSPDGRSDERGSGWVLLGSQAAHCTSDGCLKAQLSSC